MIKINGQDYELKFSLKRIEMIENATGEPFMVAVQKNNAMLSISNLKTYFGLAIKEAGSDIFLTATKGMELAEKAIEEIGFVPINMAVINTIQRDCPFFFQVD